MRCWAMVAARGGSKSIPKKNLVRLAGVPLLDYGVRAVQHAQRCDRIICSTDDDEIANRAKLLGIEIDRRPSHLAHDDARVVDAMVDLVGRLGVSDRLGPPDVVVLVQPTSPFLLANHVISLLDAIAAAPEAGSGQTVTRVQHNHHAWNQRVVENGLVRFHFERERAAAYNKQRKPELFVFGNLVATRLEALLGDKGVFAVPSVAVEIPAPYDFDLDEPGDLARAEALIAQGLVDLPHIMGAKRDRERGD